LTPDLLNAIKRKLDFRTTLCIIVIHIPLEGISKVAVLRRHAYKVKLSKAARTLSNHHLRFRFHNPSNNNDGGSRARVFTFRDFCTTVIGRRRCQGGWYPRASNTHVSTITPLHRRDLRLPRNAKQRTVFSPHYHATVLDVRDSALKPRSEI